MKIWIETSKAVLRIHDILVWIRILLFRHWPLRRQQKQKVLKKFFCLLIFEGTFTSFFKDNKSKRRKTVGIKFFHTIIAWQKKDPEPEPDPDPGGQKLTDPDSDLDP